MMAGQLIPQWLHFNLLFGRGVLTPAQAARSPNIMQFRSCGANGTGDCGGGSPITIRQIGQGPSRKNPTPELRNQIEVGINKHSGAKQIITIGDRDNVHFNRYNRKWIVNGIAYPSNKYMLSLDRSVDLKAELKALVTIDLLRKKLITHFNSTERLRYLDGYDRILKIRRISKGKQIIKKYLSGLKTDTNFKIESVGKGVINLLYTGEYASCKRSVVF